MFITNNHASFHLWSNMKRSENIMTMVVSKSAKVIAKFALRKDVEIVLKSKKKLKYVNCLEFYSNTDENRNRGLRNRNRNHQLKQRIIQRMLMLVRKTGQGKFIFIKVSVPIIGFFTVRG